MAKSLSAFLAQNAKKIENQFVVASARFVGEDEKPMQWEICGITADEAARIRRGSFRNVQTPGGRRGQYTQEFDANTYLARMAVRCTVFPDLNSTELQESYGVMSAEQLLQKMLTPAEFEDYTTAVMELNGFKATDELVEEAKN